MTKEEYWEFLVEKNPSFKGENVKITVSSLKRIVYQAHDKGKEDNNKKDNTLDVLRNIFGMK